MRAITLFLTLAATLLVASAFAAAGPEDRLVQKGDRYYENRGKGRCFCVKSIECFEKALAVNPDSVEASWKLAKACYWLGMHTEGDAEKLKIYKKGIDIAKRAISIDPKSAASHFWLGVSYGKFGETKGVMDSLALVSPIKEEMQKVLSLDPNFEEGGGHRVLGRLYFKLPGIAGGDNALAIDHLKKAVEIGEAHLLNHVFLAEVLIAEDRKEEARERLQFVIDAPYQEHRKPENEEEKEQAKKMLEELD